MTNELRQAAIRLLEMLAVSPLAVARGAKADVAALLRSDLASLSASGHLAITEAGRSFLARKAAARAGLSPDEAFQLQHRSLIEAAGVIAESGRGAKFNEAESPLVWLARRKGPDGRPLIELHQLQAGERLRAEFTFAQMMPRTTANWHSPVAGRGRGGSRNEHMTERMISARQRLRQALDAAGPEFAGLLLDVCCFLKKLDEVERERRWPARSAKVVLQLGLERLARHFGYGSQAQGRPRTDMQAWAAEQGLGDAQDLPLG